MHKKIYFYIKKIFEIILNLILVYIISVIILKYYLDISYQEIFQDTLLILEQLYTYYKVKLLISIIYIIFFFFYFINYRLVRVS